MPDAPCPVYGTHRMYSQGFANIFDANTGNRLYSGWGWYKCGCKELFTCSGYPHTGGKIANYVTYGGMTQALINGTTANIYVDPNYIYYTSSSTLSGYQFLSQ